jgi:hypothetical protein
MDEGTRAKERGHDDVDGKHCATHELDLLLCRPPSGNRRGGIVADAGFVTLPPGRSSAPAGGRSPSA